MWALAPVLMLFFISQLVYQFASNRAPLAPRPAARSTRRVGALSAIPFDGRFACEINGSVFSGCLRITHVSYVNETHPVRVLGSCPRTTPCALRLSLPAPAEPTIATGSMNPHYVHQVVLGRRPSSPPASCLEANVPGNSYLVFLVRRVLVRVRYLLLVPDKPETKEASMDFALVSQGKYQLLVEMDHGSVLFA